MNNLYDTRLCYTHTVQCHTDHSLQCWSEVIFFKLYQNVCLLLLLCTQIALIFHKLIQRRIYSVVGYIIITLLRIVHSVRVKKIYKSVHNW